jgi:hypothetical protein
MAQRLLFTASATARGRENRRRTSTMPPCSFERGEPAQPPATIPSHRKDAWLKGWADQKTFMERKATGRKQKHKAGAKQVDLDSR